ncbi:MAG: stage II sporulation protein R [Christensenellales bacterium]
MSGDNGGKKKMAVALFLAIIMLFCGCAEPPLRLHIKANSNSAKDQKIKLVVRDAVLYATKDKISKCENQASARAYIEESLETIKETADKVLSDGGFEYETDLKVGVFHFPEKTYKGKTYPEGDYQALSLTLGEGEGENWWCVMFPPLCITELEKTDEQDVEYTSFLAELFKSLFG